MPDPLVSSFINRPLIIGVAVVVAVVVGGVVLLATWEIPAPKTHVEKVIPNERLPR